MGNYIISDPEILGGTPVIKGTRVSVGRILFLLKDGYTLEACQVPEKLVHPQLSC